MERIAARTGLPRAQSKAQRAERTARRTRQIARVIERIMNAVFVLCGLVSIAAVALITGYIIWAGLPAIREIGLTEFLFGRVWASTAAEPKFGILPFILTSVYGTAGAMVIGVPVGFLTAVFLSKVASPRVAAVIRPAVDLLAGIPSVVYGLVGMMILLPAIRKAFHLAVGDSLLAAILVLAVMILPSIINVSETALRAVPKDYEDASLALGATELETYFRVSVPAAKSGIATAIVLGVGRAIGEAMAISLVSGSSVNLPLPFNSVRFLTTAIVAEMGYASGVHREVLFTIGLVLFVFIMVINLILTKIIQSEEKEG